MKKNISLDTCKKKNWNVSKHFILLGFFFFLCSNLHNNEILCMITYYYVFYYKIWKYGLMEWLFQSLKQTQMQMLNSKQKKMKREETKLLGLKFYIKKKCLGCFVFAGPHWFSWILNLILSKEAVDVINNQDGMSSVAPWGPMRSFHDPTLQTLDGEEEERRIYYLSRSERRYTNFNRLRCCIYYGQKSKETGGRGAEI